MPTKKKKNFSWGKNQGRNYGVVTREPQDVSRALVPYKEDKIIEMKKSNGTWLAPESKPAPRFVESSSVPKKSFWDRFQNREETRAWGQKDFPIRQNMTRTAGGIRQLGGGVKDIGSAITSFPAGGMIRNVVDVFVMAWNKMSTTMKLLIALVFFVAILFVPWGIFYYVGWAVGAAFMFLISLIYWVFVNLFNGLASGIIAIINGVATVFMGFIIWVVEAIMHIFMGSSWSWWNGRALMENSLISYHSIAGNVPSLLTIQTPVWQGWFNTTLIVKLFEHIPALQGIVDAYNDFIVAGMRNAFAGFVNTAEGWQVILVGLIPLFAVIGVLIYIYYTNRYKIQQSY